MILTALRKTAQQKTNPLLPLKFTKKIKYSLCCNPGNKISANHFRKYVKQLVLEKLFLSLVSKIVITFF